MGTRFGDFFKELRIKTGVSLRAFCEVHGLDAGYVSRVERGRLAPPDSDDKLNDLALALGLAPNSEDWQKFFDLAAAERGKIPSDLMDDELVGKLPVLFRTIRGLKADGDALDELVKKIREA